MAKEIELKGYRKYDEDFWRKGFTYDVPAGGASFSEKFDENVWLSGGFYQMQFGYTPWVDMVDFEVVDLDDILGFGAGAVLNRYVEDEWLCPEGKAFIVSDDAKKVQAGLYLRINIDNSSESTLKFGIKYHLRRK